MLAACIFKILESFTASQDDGNRLVDLLCKFVSTHMSTYNVYAYIYAHVFTRVDTHAYKPVYTHVYTRVYVHAHTCAYRHA